MDEVMKDGASGEYSVISYNEEGEPTQPFFTDTTEVIPGCSSSGAELAALTKATPPHRTNYKHPDYENVRRDNIVEKCIFCDHRVKNGLLPSCVEACPSSARIFGDLNDPGSDAAKLLVKYESVVLKEEEGTRPNVHYIRDYSAR
jgi:ferredoxin